MTFESWEWIKILKYLKSGKDHTEELYEAMKDIETFGEVDHDGMPVVNTRELQEDLKHMDEIIKKIEKNLTEMEK